MTGHNKMTRRELMAMLSAAGAGSALLRPSFLIGEPADSQSGWVKYKRNPVLGGQYGTCFDISVLRESESYKMWVSWRPKSSIAITESKDGLRWNRPEIVLAPRPVSGWEDDVNRPVVVHRNGTYHMWYTGQSKEQSKIGYATSSDGRSWRRESMKPVLEPDASWEGVAVMCPHVLWDETSNLWKMWYSGGQQYEPNAIGYATSEDGLHWTKHSANPVLAPDRRYGWEKDRVTAAQIIHWDDWYYAFYIGFRDIDHAQIGLARSKDGISNWVRHAANPIVRPTPGGWDADACYKPFAVYSEGRWRLWYNGRHEHLEQIGLVTRDGPSLGFEG